MTEAQQQAIKILCDSKFGIVMANNPIFYDCTKNIVSGITFSEKLNSIKKKHFNIAKQKSNWQTPLLKHYHKTNLNIS